MDSLEATEVEEEKEKNSRDSSRDLLNLQRSHLKKLLILDR